MRITGRLLPTNNRSVWIRAYVFRTAKTTLELWGLKKICLVPITLPYLVFVPYPKVFFANPTGKLIVPTQKIDSPS